MAVCWPLGPTHMMSSVTTSNATTAATMMPVFQLPLRSNIPESASANHIWAMLAQPPISVIAGLTGTGKRPTMS
jgi:hypothetical protein